MEEETSQTNRAVTVQDLTKRQFDHLVLIIKLYSGFGFKISSNADNDALLIKDPDNGKILAQYPLSNISD